MRIITGKAHPELGQAICDNLGINPACCNISRFPDGETKVEIKDDVRGMNIFIVQPTCTPVNESFMELFILADALKRASAKSINAVVPYYGYARQDRKHMGRVPITAKLVANLLTASGVNRMLCMDLHATQIQGFFDIPMDHLLALPIFLPYLREIGVENPVFMSPDVGSIKLADNFAKQYPGDIAVASKRRLSDTQVEHGHVIGDVKNRDVIIIDDMISTGGSMVGAIEIAREYGAKSVKILATHGLFSGSAFEKFAKTKPDEIIVSDTVPQKHHKVPEGLKFTILSVAPLLADAITRIHNNRSVSLMFMRP